MRQSDRLPPDPEILDELEAIDAALLGLRVDPMHAELAELTVLLADDRPAIDPDFARALDARVAHRFAPMPENAGGATSAGRAPDRPRRRRRALRWTGSAIGGAIAVAFAAVVVVVGMNNGPVRVVDHSASSAPGAARHSAGTGTGFDGVGPVTRAAKSRGAVPNGSVAATTTATNGSVAATTTATSFGAAGSSAGATGSPVTAPGATAAPTAATPAPGPVSNGRRVVQSAQLALTSSGAHLDYVSQEVFNVVGEENGIVRNSSVTSGSNGYATFSLSIPSQNLQQTMTNLSELRYATVASRTDATRDVNDQYLNDVRALADARALRTSLLKQLANAVTQAQIDSLNAQIHDAEASIGSDEATLNGLQSKINFSSLDVQINAAPFPVTPPVATPSKGFTIGHAAHDAVRVLTVAAGVALIAFAALVPFALIAALVAWIGYWVRRRRREQALDAT